MALATAIAAAISKRTALAILGLVALSAPAVAGEQVYVWRDGNGAVRFSAVEDAERGAAPQSTVEPAPAACELPAW